MTEPLSPDRLELLLPALRHVAEMAQKGAALGREDLRLLLVASDLDEDWALDELERWVKVLTTVRGMADPARRELAQRALMLRGVPEAAAMLAVSIAVGAGKEQAVPPAQGLSATVERLDLGTLLPGQGATAEFEVQGGPGQVVVESDQVRVTPDWFGPGATRIRVAVRPMSGGVLWTTLRLITAGETLEIPVVAQWQTPLVMPELPAMPELVMAASPRREDPLLPWPQPVTATEWSTVAVQEMRRLGEHAGRVRSVAFSPVGRILASGSDDRTVRLWDVATGREVSRLEGHMDWVRSVAFSPDGRLLASGGADRAVRLWDVASGQTIPRLMRHTGGVESVAFSPDGRTLASGSDDMTVRLWDVASGRAVHSLKWHTDGVSSVAFSPDGRALASGSADGTVRLWGVASGLNKSVMRHASSVGSVAFSPDGQALASGSRDGTVRLWDVTSGREMRRFAGHGSGVRSVAFSPDGRLLASGSLDKTVRVWDAASGRELWRLEGHTGGVYGVAFSPDGLLVASGGEDRSVRVWQVG